MKPRTRKLLLDIATAVALAATATVMFTPAALAAPATATANANVRESPGGAVIGTLRRGDTVELLGCSASWCELERGGFVSSSLLRRDGDVGVGISIGPGGISVDVGNGRRPGPEPIIIDDDEEEFAEVCFFSRTGYRGESFCMEEGESMRRLRDWNDEISSFRNPEGLEVRVCREPGYDDCRTYTSSARSLRGFDDDISSIRIR